MKLIMVIATILLLKAIVAQADVSSPQISKGVANQIPKILWTYWDSGYQGAQLFTKLCINNMELYARRSGWQFRFLTKENLTLFISLQSQQRMKKMIQTSKNYILLQNKVDIYRLFLLYQNGGMWLDTNSFFVDDLTWIQHINKQTTPFNRISSDPDVITFTYNPYGGNKTKVINPGTGEQVYLFPGIQIWSLITKPYSKFITDIIKNLQYSLPIPRINIEQQNRKNGFLYGEESDVYFMTSNYQFQTVLQKKQKEIQRNPDKYNTRYAVDYYKVWSIDAVQSAFALFQVNSWTLGTIITSLFYDSIESFSSHNHLRIYFFKFTSHFYPFINFLLPHIQYMSCLDVFPRIPKDSILYKHLLEPSSADPIALGLLNQINNTSSDKQCTLFFKSTADALRFNIFLILIGVITVGVAIFCLMKSVQKKAYKQFVTIDSVDNND